MARATLLHLVRRDPRPYGIARGRGRLTDVLACAPTLRLHTPQGLGPLLVRLGISDQRGRDYVHSPDPDYDAKLAAIRAAGQAARVAPERHVLLYLDEVTVCRQPTVARAWEERGCAPPLARRGHRGDTQTRLLGALEARTGAVHGVRAAKLTLPVLRRFFQTLAAADPGRTRTVVLDNWPVHCHPDLLVALVPHQYPFPRYRSSSGSREPRPAAVQQWGGLALPMQRLPLPTYAAWCTPIEQLWRKLRQELGHRHPWADDLPRLRAELDAWRAAPRQPSPDLRRYVGLATRD